MNNNFKKVNIIKSNNKKKDNNKKDNNKDNKKDNNKDNKKNLIDNEVKNTIKLNNKLKDNKIEISTVKKDIGIFKNIFINEICSIDDSVSIPNILTNEINSNSNNIIIKKPLKGEEIMDLSFNKIIYKPIIIENGITIINNNIQNNNSVMTRKEVSEMIDYKLNTILNNFEKRIKKLEK
jgi:hypothetical protein